MDDSTRRDNADPTPYRHPFAYHPNRDTDLIPRGDSQRRVIHPAVSLGLISYHSVSPTSPGFPPPRSATGSASFQYGRGHGHVNMESTDTGITGDSLPASLLHHLEENRRMHEESGISEEQQIRVQDEGDQGIRTEESPRVEGGSEKSKKSDKSRCSTNSTTSEPPDPTQIVRSASFHRAQLGRVASASSHRLLTREPSGASLLRIAVSAPQGSNVSQSPISLPTADPSEEKINVQGNPRDHDSVSLKTTLTTTSTPSEEVPSLADHYDRKLGALPWPELPYRDPTPSPVSPFMPRFSQNSQNRVPSPFPFARASSSGAAGSSQAPARNLRPTPSPHTHSLGSRPSYDFLTSDPRPSSEKSSNVSKSASRSKRISLKSLKSHKSNPSNASSLLSISSTSQERERQRLAEMYKQSPGDTYTTTTTTTAKHHNKDKLIHHHHNHNHNHNHNRTKSRNTAGLTLHVPVSLPTPSPPRDVPTSPSVFSWRNSHIQKPPTTIGTPMSDISGMADTSGDVELDVPPMPNGPGTRISGFSRMVSGTTMNTTSNSGSGSGSVSGITNSEGGSRSGSNRRDSVKSGLSIKSGKTGKSILSGRSKVSSSVVAGTSTAAITGIGKRNSRSAKVKQNQRKSYRSLKSTKLYDEEGVPLVSSNGNDKEGGDDWQDIPETMMDLDKLMARSVMLERLLQSGSRISTQSIKQSIQELQRRITQSSSIHRGSIPATATAPTSSISIHKTNRYSTRSTKSFKSTKSTQSTNDPTIPPVPSIPPTPSKNRNYAPNHSQRGHSTQDFPFPFGFPYPPPPIPSSPSNAYAETSQGRYSEETRGSRRSSFASSYSYITSRTRKSESLRIKLSRKLKRRGSREDTYTEVTNLHLEEDDLPSSGRSRSRSRSNYDDKFPKDRKNRRKGEKYDADGEDGFEDEEDDDPSLFPDPGRPTSIIPDSIHSHPLSSKHQEETRNGNRKRNKSTGNGIIVFPEYTPSSPLPRGIKQSQSQSQSYLDFEPLGQKGINKSFSKRAIGSISRSIPVLNIRRRTVKTKVLSRSPQKPSGKTKISSTNNPVKRRSQFHGTSDYPRNSHYSYSEVCIPPGCIPVTSGSSFYRTLSPPYIPDHLNHLNHLGPQGVRTLAEKGEVDSYLSVPRTIYSELELGEDMSSPSYPLGSDAPDHPDYQPLSMDSRRGSPIPSRAYHHSHHSHHHQNERHDSEKVSSHNDYEPTNHSPSKNGDSIVGEVYRQSPHLGHRSPNYRARQSILSHFSQGDWYTSDKEIKGKRRRRWFFVIIGMVGVVVILLVGLLVGLLVRRENS